MNAKSLGFRLVSLYALWLAIVFLAAGILLYIGLRHYLESNLRYTEVRRAERIAGLLSREDINESNLASAITASFAPEASARFVRVTGIDGRTVYRSSRPFDQSFNPEEVSPPHRQEGSRKEKLPDGSEMVISTVAASTSHAGYWIEVGESFAPALGELNQQMIWLGVGFAVVATVALVGGFLLVRRALRPVDEIMRSAERITSHSLSERLVVHPTGDEFEHLSLALNRMITRLDEAFQYNQRFLADASHELRTPLTILRAELEEMVQRDELDDSSRERMGNLLAEVERLSRIVENLFTLSRFDAGQAYSEHSRFDLGKLAVGTSDQMLLLAEDKRLAVACLTADPVFVEGDRARLKQVIVNLLDNAIKYTPSGGWVKLSVTARGNESICEVADNGIGIPAQSISRVFDRFYRVDQARSRELGGAGIWLSIVKSICTAHQGRVEVESTEGLGSIFRVYLPLSTTVTETVYASHGN